MKKIVKSSELLWLLGIIFVALGVSICSKADLGVSMIAAPAFVIYEAIAPLWIGFSVGMTEYIIQGLMLVLLCIIIGRFNWRYLFAFAVAVIYGYTLNFFLFLLSGITFDSILIRYVMLILGDIITAFGVACFFGTYLPLQVYELFVTELAGRFKLNINKVKSLFDITLLVLSFVLALTLFGDAADFDLKSIGYKSYHSIGLGTLITTAINAPIIAAMGKLIDRFFDKSPRFTTIENLFKLN